MESQDKSKYFHENHSKHSLRIHLIFCIKYRKKLLIRFGEYIKNIFIDISNKYDFTVELLEVDKDHIHMMIQYPPTITVVSIVRRLKQISTIFIWKDYPTELGREFWKEKTFWSDGYFVCSIGDASTDVIRKYIENQG